MKTLYKQIASDLKLSEPLLFPNKQFSKNYNSTKDGSKRRMPTSYRNQHEIHDLIQLICLNFVKYQKHQNILN